MCERLSRHSLQHHTAEQDLLSQVGQPPMLACVCLPLLWREQRIAPHHTSRWAAHHAVRAAGALAALGSPLGLLLLRQAPTAMSRCRHEPPSSCRVVGMAVEMCNSSAVCAAHPNKQ